jgi:uncharacterized protein YxjI
VKYPLHLSFKILAIAQQITVTDAEGTLVCYVKQKAFKLKEAITVFADAEQTRPVFYINADRIIDFSASYHFTDTNGNPLGGIRRRGMRSLWKAHYEIIDDGNVILTVQEANPWAKVFDGLLGEVPILGMFTGYFFHPAYMASRSDGTEVMKLAKQAAFLEGKYTIDKLAAVDEDEEMEILLGLIMVVLLERTRG